MTPVNEIYQKWLDLPNDVDFNNWLTENIRSIIEKERDIIIESYCSGAQDKCIDSMEAALKYYNKI